MIAAYKRADGKKLEDRRIVVDVERGRWSDIYIYIYIYIYLPYL